MKNIVFAFFAASLLPLAAEEVKAPVTGAMVFKNGVSAVRRTVQPGKLTAFELADTIEPQQGSLWFTGPVLSVIRKEGKKPVPGKYPLSNITKTFAGQDVTLLVSCGQTTRELSGTVWDPDPGKDGEERDMEDGDIWLKLANGQFIMLQQNAVRSIQVKGQPKQANRPEKFDKRPVWEFTLSKPAEQPIFVDYLTQGISWQSAYRLELGKENKMRLAMDAEIINKLADMKKIDLFLASGYANFAGSGIKSPMAMIQPDQENEPVPESAAPARYSLQRKSAASYAANDRVALSAPASFGETATGETEDITLLHLPEFTLKKGEVCHRVLDRAEGTFERLVHWQIPARRNAESGRIYHSGAPEPMDALRFKNPFDRAITSGLLEILDGGAVLAQVQLPWVNRGDTAIVNITKALTVTGKVVEYEAPPQNTARAEKMFDSVVRNKHGQIVSGVLAGRNYRVTDVLGELHLKNHREKAARILIKLNYAGTLVSADGNPENTMVDRGLSINPQTCLTWELELPARAEKVLKYRYNVFFR